ncbi:hypothetical protein, conserved [Babesia bigemina]|uniref:Uncharacterized protein n=1 Tax=Babesia bigemina TaxID=5866 RepID=A0A061BKR2_BABBI|nr:hypothetical protein, conserved [Babesia bigemina]CDR71520.1 hypothetical protein, conserved [Babesia bigemina]|eukprot:XP_012770466.1 hypothetical protein, conserved [Babesia bigemina]
MMLIDSEIEDAIGLRGGKQDGLRKIHKDLSTQQGALNNAVNAAENFYISVIEKYANSTIDYLQKFVTSEVDGATKAIQRKAQDEYYSKMYPMFTNMKTEVTSQISAIESIIATDLTSGVKGLLRKVMEKGVDESNKLTTLRLADLIDANNKKKVEELSGRFKNYADSVLFYIGYQVAGPHPGEPGKKVDSIKSNILALLKHLKTSRIYNYDHQFTSLLSHLSSSLTALHPSAFANPRHPELLDAVKKGLQGFVTEMGRVYVNGYDGGEGIDKLSNLVILKDDKVDKLTDDGRKLSKVFLTILQILSDGFYKMSTECPKLWKDKQINTYEENAFGEWFTEQGYEVNSQEGKQHGELQDKSGMTGSNIYDELLTKQLKTLPGIDFKTWKTEMFMKRKSSNQKINEINVVDILQFLYGQIEKFYLASHLRHIERPKAPCNIYRMLCWLRGLWYSPMRRPVYIQMKSLFAKPTKEDKRDYGDIKYHELIQEASQKFTAETVAYSLNDVCTQAGTVLTTILGHGHQDGRYACELLTNPDDLDYPSNAGACFDMLVDMLLRVQHQLYFLFTQCSRTNESTSWRKCWYGKDIGGSDWRCNSIQCANQICNQNGDQRANQKDGQTCEKHPDCGLKSPLQSFLEDGLQGFLPHQFKKPGCKLECTASNHRGIPCKTPMGFTDLSVTASDRGTGERLMKVLSKLCGDSNSPLNKVCSYLQCLLQRPPETLADMFSFYYHLTDRWGMHGQTHKQQAFEKKVNAANFGRSYGELKVYHLFTPSHSALKKGHSDGSLGSLVCLSRDSVVCGPYLRPISHAIYETFSAKHADKYLSWIVYLTATFYDLLKKLYDECNSKCGARGSNCHVKACVKGCPTTTIEQDPPRYHDRNCKSIVSCNSTLPTLAKYGFVFGDPERLNRDGQSHTKRTCRDFCDVFKEAFEEDSHLVKFFKTIDNFMFTIRAPFIWLNVALWSLSLFYLICVMVGRLDVLHIRSHLRIPSSHKITAQSLLAAAQVGRLAKISYLQP